mgnify:CR=1 FL=1|tara:strand:+ start:367 stop:1362 length:996 start_codon:yes stop_codon:yes gene_type:complete
MKIHHFLIILVLLFFIFRKNNIIEKYINHSHINSTIDRSSIIREDINKLKRKIIRVLNLDNQEIDPYLRDEILFSEFIASMKNNKNNDIVNCGTNDCHYNKEIRDMYLDFAEKYDNILISEEGGGEDMRNNIDQRIEEDKKYYKDELGEPLRYEQVSKKHLDTIYKKCIDDYEILKNTQNCDEEIENVKKDEKKKHNVTLDNLNNEISDLKKKMKNYNVLEKRVLKLTAELLKKNVTINNKKIKHYLSKPKGVIFLNKFPKDESNHRLRCINGLRKRKNDNEACSKACRRHRDCKYVWQYSNMDRCCFKTRYSTRRGFRHRVPGWYVQIRK